MPLSSDEYSDIVDIYQQENDSMIDNLGKLMVLYFNETIESDVLDAANDNVRGESIRKPSYKDDAPVTSQTTRNVRALIQHDPKDFKTFDQRLLFSKNIIRLKTYLSEAPYLQKCDYLIPDFETKEIVYGKYGLIRQPFPIGLKENRYCISFWEIIA